MLACPDKFHPSVNLRAGAIPRANGDRGERFCVRMQAAPRQCETGRLAPIGEKFAELRAHRRGDVTGDRSVDEDPTVLD